MIRYDVIQNLSRQDDKLTGWVWSNTIMTPSPGEIVNLKGNPFIVHGIGHAVDDRGMSFSYVSVIPAYNITDPRKDAE